MIKQQEKFFSYNLLTLDYAGILMAYMISCHLAPLISSLIQSGDVSLFFSAEFKSDLFMYLKRYHNFILPLLLFPFFSFKFSQAYRLIKLIEVKDILREMDLLFGVAMILLAIWLFLTPIIVETTIFVFLMLLILWMAYIANRLIFLSYYKKRPESADFVDHILFVGTDSKTRELANFLCTNSVWPIKVVGFLTNKPEEKNLIISGISVLGTIDELPRVIRENVIDAVLVSGGVKDTEYLQRIANIGDMAGIDIILMANMVGNVKYPSLEKLGNYYFLVFKSVYQPAGKMFIKRLFDIAVSLLMVIACLPIWIIVSALIKHESSGPVFFSQERVGKNGRRFKMYKFRSMVADAEIMQEKLLHLNEMDGPVFKIKNDPRVTGIGQFIRKTSIDELPQLFNILKGDMSLVGPRPPVPKEVATYGLYEKKRLSIMPGLTCLWQISGRNEVKFEEWMRLDIYYIDNWSLTLDFKILVKTFFVVLAKKGAQ